MSSHDLFWRIWFLGLGIFIGFVIITAFTPIPAATVSDPIAISLREFSKDKTYNEETYNCGNYTVDGLKWLKDRGFERIYPITGKNKKTGVNHEWIEAVVDYEPQSGHYINRSDYDVIHDTLTESVYNKGWETGYNDGITNAVETELVINNKNH